MQFRIRRATAPSVAFKITLVLTALVFAYYAFTTGVFAAVLASFVGFIINLFIGLFIVLLWPKMPLTPAEAAAAAKARQRHGAAQQHAAVASSNSGFMEDHGHGFAAGAAMAAMADHEQQFGFNDEPAFNVGGTPMMGGGFDMNGNTISNGDVLRVVGFMSNGAVRPYLWRNLNNGSSGGFATLPSIVVGFLGGCIIALMGASHDSTGVMVLGGLFSALCVGVGFLRSRALRLLRAA